MPFTAFGILSKFWRMRAEFVRSMDMICLQHQKYVFFRRLILDHELSHLKLQNLGAIGGCCFSEMLFLGKAIYALPIRQ